MASLLHLCFQYYHVVKNWWLTRNIFFYLLHPTPQITMILYYHTVVSQRVEYRMLHQWCWIHIEERMFFLCVIGLIVKPGVFILTPALDFLLHLISKSYVPFCNCYQTSSLQRRCVHMNLNYWPQPWLQHLSTTAFLEGIQRVDEFFIVFLVLIFHWTSIFMDFHIDSGVCRVQRDQEFLI